MLFSSEGSRMWRWLTERIFGIPNSTESISGHQRAFPQAANGETTVLYARVRGGIPPDPLLLHDESSIASETVSPNAVNPAGLEESDSPRNQGQTKQEGTGNRRRSRAHRFSVIFSDMTPREAKMLFCVHRRTLRQLASESPAALRRDLQRFVLSSRGRLVSRDHPAPTMVRVRQWVSEARSLLGESVADIKPRPLKLAR